MVSDRSWIDYIDAQCRVGLLLDNSRLIQNPFATKNHQPVEDSTEIFRDYRRVLVDVMKEVSRFTRRQG